MNIRVKITRDGSNTIKTIDLEEYLRCVVPSEMPASWPAEALKAQAVAARTYAMRRIQTRQTKEYDVDDTVAFQAYRIGNEHPSTDKAIKDTVNQYLTYNGKIIDAVYSSSNGGRTYSAEERWGGTIAYLISQPDPFNKETKNGHGVGMSQYGARHRAEAGQTYDEILAFYYTKTVLENFTKEIKVDFNFTQYYLTKNECYLSGKKMTPAGIIVHSTGANNKTLKRYIGPDDGKLGVNKYGNHWNQVMDRKVCVHAFIGTLADGTVACYQTLPWDMVGWHSGGGANGSANNMGYIGFEICEDDLTDAKYFNEIYEMAAHLCAYLCQEYKISVEKVICHSEAHTLGIASNHGDVMHWFPKFGKNMDMFRAYVKTLVGNIAPEPIPIPTPTPTPIPTPTPTPAFVPYKVRVIAGALNYRSGPGTQYKVNGVITDKGIYTIVGEENGWGKLKSGAGWISLKYTSRLDSTSTPAPEPRTYREYVVKKGDSLWEIAKAELHSGVRYNEIKELNGLKSDLIRVGDVLKLPIK